MKKPSPRRRRRPGKRVRGIPIQVYVSATEHRELGAIAAKREITVSALVRRWIRKATAAANGRAPKPVYEDPRQLRFAPDDDEHDAAVCDCLDCDNRRRAAATHAEALA